jgi:putative oxidoreductase
VSTDTSMPGTHPSTTADVNGQDIGLLVLRFTVGLLVAAHGAQKLFGWFAGDGLEGTAAFLAELGYSPAMLFAVVTGVSELGGGLLLAAGCATPLAVAAVVGTMVNAVAAVWPAGLWAPEGYEYPLVVGVLCGVVALTGPGSLSADVRVSARSPWLRGGLRPAAVSLAVGLGAGVLTLFLRT